MGFIDLFHCVKWGLALSPTSVCRLCLTEVQYSWVKSSLLFVSFHLPGINLCLLGKPEIVSHEGPVDGQVRCVAEGFPAPRITWYYCEQPYARWGLFSRPLEKLLAFSCTCIGGVFCVKWRRIVPAQFRFQWNGSYCIICLCFKAFINEIWPNKTTPSSSPMCFWVLNFR